MIDKISVIIPIYNVEKYLKKCIESVINQTYKNIEIILVNDGSTDDSLIICNSYKEKDKRIIVINKENGGLSDARNVGIDIATGDWLIFIDSDDYVDNDYVEYLFNLVKIYSSDIGIVLPLYVNDNYIETRKTNKEKKYIFNNIDALKIMLYQKKFDTSAWGKIYKKNLFEDIRFPFGKLYEDISTIYKVILKSNKIVYSNQKKYMYLQRKDSIMGRKFKPRDLDYVFQAKVMYDDICILSDIKLVKAAKCRFLNANFSILLKLKRNKKYNRERKVVIKNIKKYRKEVLFDYNSRFKTKVAIVFSYLGIL